MTDKIDLFKSLLNREFWLENNYRLSIDIFPDILHELYEALEIAHDTIKGDSGNLTCRDLYSVFLAVNPTLTASNKALIVDLLKQIHEAQELSPDIRNYVLGKALVELKATRIAQAALEIAHGKSEDWSKLEALLKEDATQEEISLVTTNLDTLTKDISSGMRWHYNLPDLDRALGPVGPGMFNVLAGPVNSGKSALAISFTGGPGGFLDQGATVLYIGNEEALRKTMLRLVSAYTGMTKEEVFADLPKAQGEFDKVSSKLLMIEDYSMTFNKLNHIMEKKRPDIVVIDMVDKVGIARTFAREDQRLGAIYEQARESAKKYDAAVFGLSQTDAQAFGKLYYSFNRLHASKVEKGANADTIILIGAQSGEFIAEGDNNFRVLNIAKSKDEGNGQKINCQIRPMLSRFVP